MRIHIVNEEPILSKIIRSFLSKAGYKVQIEKTISELYLNIKRNTHELNVILIYDQLYSNTRITIINELHTRCPEAVIILITTDPPFLSAKEALAHGVSAYLRKPVYLAELELILTQLTEHHITENYFCKDFVVH